MLKMRPRKNVLLCSAGPILLIREKNKQTNKKWKKQNKTKQKQKKKKKKNNQESTQFFPDWMFLLFRKMMEKTIHIHNTFGGFNKITSF